VNQSSSSTIHQITIEADIVLEKSVAIALHAIRILEPIIFAILHTESLQGYIFVVEIIGSQKK
jgi:hypothetical protein